MGKRIAFDAEQTVSGHQGEAHVFDDAAGDDVRTAQPGEQDLARAAPFEVQHDQSPHHAQRQAVEKNRGDLPILRQHGKQHQRQLRDDDQGDQRGGSPASMGLGAHLDADELGEGVAHNLADDQRRLQLNLGAKEKE